jgi:hypothetical protein
MDSVCIPGLDERNLGFEIQDFLSISGLLFSQAVVDSHEKSVLGDEESILIHHALSFFGHLSGGLLLLSEY